MTHCVVSISGGLGSFGAAWRALDRFGPDSTTFLFADTLIEDEDLYRFLGDIEHALDHPIVRIADGRDPWQVFFDTRFIGNSRVDPCSRVLKRELLRKWIDQNRPNDNAVVFGIDWTEDHRTEAIRRNYKPHTAWFPLIDDGVDKSALFDECDSYSIEPPRLYALGFQHNNCGGFCIKGGQAQFANLLDKFPERYTYHEEREQALRDHLGKDVAIMRDRRLDAREQYALKMGLEEVPKAIPMTMAAFRERVESGDYDRQDWGGCGCALDDNPSQLTLDLFDTPVTVRKTA